MISAFESKYPKYKVEVQIAPWQTVDNQLIQAVNAGKGPDVALLYSGRLGQHLRAGTLKPLDGYVSIWSAKDQVDWVVPPDVTVYDGKKLGIFADQRTFMLMYRSDLLAARGAAQAPATWDELGQVAGKITNGSTWGLMLGLGLGDQAVGFGEFFASAMAGAGGQILDAKDKPLFASKPGAQVFQLIHDLIKQDNAVPPSAVSATASNYYDGMKAGSYGMIIGGTHRVDTIKAGAALGANLKEAPIPSFSKSAPSPAIAAGQTYAMPKNVANPDAAWAFIEHMSSPEMELINAKVGGQMPPRKSVWADPWFQSPAAADMTTWKRYLDTHGTSYQFPVRFAEVCGVLAKHAELMITQGVDPAKALDDAAAEWTKSL